MSREDRADLIFLILLPVLAALAFNLWPRPFGLDQVLVSAALARSERFPGEYNGYLYQALEIEPWRGELWEEIGAHELAQENWNEAVEALAKAQRAGELTAAGHLSMGKAYEGAGSADKAIESYLRAASIDPTLKAAFRQAANLQRARGDLEGAARTLRLWLARGSADGAARYELGVLEAGRDLNTSLGYLQAAAKEETVSGKAETLSKDLLRASLESDQAYRSLLAGRALARQGEWDAAAGLFERTTDLAPDYAEGWAFLGQARQELGQDGLPALRQAVRLDPRSVTAQSLLALYWRQNNQPGLALVYLNRLANQNPQEAVWELELGNVLVEMGNLFSAAEHFQRAVELDTGNVDAWRALAEFAIVHSFEPRTMGLPSARKVLLLTPNDPAALDLMGWVLLNLEDLTSAERFLHLAMQKDARYAPAYLHLGQLYLQKGQSQLAESHLWKAANYAEPESPTAIIARRLLER